MISFRSLPPDRRTAYLIGALALSLALLVFGALLWMQMLNSDILTISSSDGAASLSIPGSALPAGLDADDIAVKKLDARLAAQAGVPGTVSGYELLPSDTAFQEPVTLTLTLPKDGSIPLFIHQHGASASFLIPDAVYIDPQRDTARVALSIDHFSSVMEAARDIFHYELASGGEAYIGDSLPFTLTIRPDEWEHAFSTGSTLSLRPGSWYDVKPFTITAPSFLSPAALDSPLTKRTQTQEFAFNGSLTCMEEGSGPVSIAEVPITFRATQTRREFDLDRGDVDNEYWYNFNTTLFIEPGFYACKEGEMRLISPPVLCDPSGEIAHLPACP